MKTDLIFRKFDGTRIEDVNAYVKNWALENPHGDIIIGCDSQEHSRYVTYAIAIVMHYKTFLGNDKSGEPIYRGKGAHVIKSIIKDKAHRTPMSARKGRKDFDTNALQGKLWREVELTIQTANMIRDCNKQIKIHVDYNSDETAGSNFLYAAGVGYAQGLGYEAEGKPHAWAATKVADSLCR